MRERTKPPRKKSRGGPEHTGGKRPGEKDLPAAAERTEERESTVEREAAPAAQGGSPQQEPVTNHDEQEKITNAGETDLPITDE